MSSTRLKIFDAIPAYFGGKQKLARRIVKQAEGATTFIDAFSGGGVVSLAAKAQGFKVISNDYSRRSFTVLRALIENDSRKIKREDVYSLLQETETDGTTGKKKAEALLEICRFYRERVRQNGPEGAEAESPT